MKKTLVGLVLAAFFGSSLSAEPPTSTAIPREDLESFLDGLISGRMKSYDVVGATIRVALAGARDRARGAAALPGLEEG